MKTTSPAIFLTALSLFLTSLNAYHTDKKGSMASTNYIANLGNEVWSRFDIILDLADNKIYLKKN